jgi:uncharacterized protein YwgA
VILLGLVQALKDNSSWCGETHIQKAVYFLQAMARVPLGFDFILYKHGPFSFDLADEITSMRADKLLRLVAQPYPYGPSILPGEASQSLMKRFPKTLTKFAPHIGLIAEKLGGKKVSELERLATALYATIKNETDGDLQSRAARIHELKPHVAVDEALEATRMVDELREESERVLAA